MTDETQAQGQTTSHPRHPTLMATFVVTMISAISAGAAAGMASHNFVVGSLTLLAVFTALLIIRNPRKHST